MYEYLKNSWEWMLRSALWRQKGWKIMASESIMRKMMHARKKPCTRKPIGGRSGIIEVAYKCICRKETNRICAVQEQALRINPIEYSIDRTDLPLCRKITESV